MPDASDKERGGGKWTKRNERKQAKGNELAKLVLQAEKRENVYRQKYRAEQYSQTVYCVSKHVQFWINVQLWMNASVILRPM